ncbi:2Fe-2S iron-sulfur cluster binding domain-containing protein [Pandoraea fibrosis]|uniref:2Fe-2S iron-sulfur cluster binding domain-containing protein n=1 Tax=Pandoraea fibrosis TaxID=1891094 RepID=A0ABX6HWN1_9BURK|nr:2Fe-2S iron-sulfur cluster-binding protein [Pandoraea fibrosis]QHE94444.1 2Fe-2S iron-sulfur cluster binding domain-containing protein [Pandoraea fibrosis]QHF15282.1 2Fe-2S iron-sulfur cluster binding domain-containing protein [Pandoraea fibrosis]
MSIVHLTSGREFAIESGSSILDAASSAGIALPYSCRTGRCSACKALVRRGQTRSLTDETGLSPEEIERGWILTCVRTAETDVELDTEDLGGITLPQPKTLPCRIAELEKLAPDVVRVKLRLPPTSAFSFIPGQYINVIGANGLRRSYSLANASHVEKLLELHIRAVNGGAMSDYWFNHARTNDLLRLNGPLGTFFLRGCANTDIFFLATGTGIAPVKAILESLTQMHEEQLPRSVTVLWGGRKPEDFYMDIAAIPGKHRYIPAISRHNEGWTGAKGYVQDILLSTAPDLSNSAVYACGSDNMIHDAKKLLSDAGLPLERFYSDAFVSSGNI